MQQSTIYSGEKVIPYNCNFRCESGERLVSVLKRAQHLKKMRMLNAFDRTNLRAKNLIGEALKISAFTKITSVTVLQRQFVTTPHKVLNCTVQYTIYPNKFF